MKGWRTLALNLAAVILPVLQTADITWLTPNQMAVYTMLVAAANFALRFFTTTPVGQNIPPTGTILITPTQAQKP